MAYARGFKRAGRGGSTSSASFRRSKPSARKITRKLKTVKKRKVAVAKNTVAIRNLKTQVNQGPVSKALHMSRDYEGTSWFLSTAKPMSFLANDFTRYDDVNTYGGQIYNGVRTVVAGTGNDLSTYDTAMIWYAKQPGFQQGFNQAFCQWENNDHQVSRAGYMPISSNITMEFKWTTIARTQPARRIRIDIIRPKRLFVRSARNVFQMPECLGAFGQMAAPLFSVDSDTALPDTNDYDRSKWHVKSKWLYIPSGASLNQGSGADVTNYSKSTTMKITFPRQRCELDLNRVDDLAWQNMQPHKQVWVVVSQSADAVPLSSTTSTIINMQRKNFWRDYHDPKKPD